MNPTQASEMFNRVVSSMRSAYSSDKIETGAFGQYMHIEMMHDGPVTILLDSRDK